MRAAFQANLPMPEKSHIPTIDDDEMRRAIGRSGYPLEQRVRRVLEKHDYYVQTNEAYPDPDTGISREYDFSAMSAVQPFGRERDFVFTIIVGECQNNAQPIVFFEGGSGPAFLHHQDVQCSGLPVKLWTGEEYQGITDALSFEKFHHYCKEPTATQYCTFEYKAGRWIALHPEVHHQTFRKLVDAVEAMKTAHYESWVMPDAGEREPVNIQIYYPLLIVQGDMYLARVGQSGLILKRANHIRYRQEIWAAKLRHTYQIDVIRERFLSGYLKLVEREAELMRRRLKTHRKAVQSSIDRLIRDVRRTRAKEKPWQKIFE